MRASKRTPEPFRATLARNLRAARLAASLTQEELGLMVLPPVTRSAVAQWECPAGVTPGVIHVASLSIALGVTIDWLMGVDVPRALSPECESAATEIAAQLPHMHGARSRRAFRQILKLIANA